MRFVSFNVNGLRARLDQLRAVIHQHQPAVIGLQETKVEDSLFPRDEIAALGYQAVFHGQKGHYGVALLTRETPLSAACGFPHDGEEAQCRLVRVSLDLPGGPLHIYNGYFPQGENSAHPLKYPAKAAFYRNLLAHLREQHRPDERILVMGDMNVAPFDKDIGIGEANRKRWLREGKCCFLPEERQWLQALADWGLGDTFEGQNPAEGEHRYSWFDYRSKGFEDSPRRGLRIDLILASPPLMDRVTGAGIDHGIRAMDRPSDHAPVWVDLDLEK
ncbi:MAG: exodeoxyribonuclease III [Porticoccaceae bacterium]